MLTGKIAIVTGGSRGIGKAVASKLASLGADLAVIYAGNQAAAEVVCSDIISEFGVRAIPYRCNVADFTETKSTVEQIKGELGGVDILINNAGITKDKLLAVMSEADYDEVLDVNLKGAFNMIRHCTGIFLRRNGGCIINISSVSGLMGNAGQANYSASKAGMIGLTKSAARELASKSIRCNAIAPGFIATDMTNEINSPLAESIPLKRFGRPEDVAEAAAYLISAEYITGEVLRVDGGLGI
ncbi:MAG: 3-oxoacyl-ACP reductase FabG [Clostridia bacterium]|nr:3-oxoacyl-ACP reductase FabG [Clostridia bacterium]